MRVPISLLLIILFAACGNDTEVVEEEAVTTLEGRWELETARRDNVKTPLLDGLYFNFGGQGEFQTNLLTNADQHGTYLREEDRIKTTEVAVPLTYTIRALTDDQLLLRATYEGYLFDFDLRRQTDTQD